MILVQWHWSEPEQNGLAEQSYCKDRTSCCKCNQKPCIISAGMKLSSWCIAGIYNDNVKYSIAWSGKISSNNSRLLSIQRIGRQYHDGLDQTTPQACKNKVISTISCHVSLPSEWHTFNKYFDCAGGKVLIPTSTFCGPLRRPVKGINSSAWVLANITQIIIQMNWLPSDST